MVTERFVIVLNRETVFEAPIMTNDKHSVCVCVCFPGCPLFLQRADSGSCVWNLIKVFTCWACLGLETTIQWVKLFKILHLLSHLSRSWCNTSYISSCEFWHVVCPNPLPSLFNNFLSFLSKPKNNKIIVMCHLHHYSKLGIKLY